MTVVTKNSASGSRIGGKRSLSPEARSATIPIPSRIWETAIEKRMDTALAQAR